jgi:UDP-N-acetylglucosamine--N-acetylmuramyl-(pentapeptide) pyrophosphoryl-undecaprenol N-acetylglucosamine transferase
MKKKVIVLVGGGTKGHLFPAISVGQDLQNDEDKIAVIISDISDPIATKGLKTILIPRMVPKSGIINMFVLIWNMLITLIRLVCIYIQLRPKIVIGFGGFTAFIPLVAARILRIPVILHEQNSVLGKVNEIMSNYACKISLGFFEALILPKKYAHKCVFSKNPIRSQIKHSQNTPNSQVFSILVIGGSQGARAFNTIIPNAIKELRQLHPNQQILITQQAHQDQQEYLQNFYNEIKVKCELEQFFLNMSDKYSKANLVICRSGASTIEELVSIHKPSILIPLPIAVRNHQAINAAYLESLGCGWLVYQDTQCSTNLANRLSLILQFPQMLQDASKQLSILANKPKNTLAQEIIKTLNALEAKSAQ